MCKTKSTQENISKMRLLNDESFQQVPNVNDSILVELQQKFGLNTGRDDRLDTVWEKATKEERMDKEEEVAPAKQRMKKRMDATPSKAALPQQRPPLTLVAPKAIGVVANVSKRPATKKQQQPSPSTKGKD